MKDWLRVLFIVLVIWNTIVSSVSLRAQTERNPPPAMLQLENNSDISITLCDIKAEQKPSNDLVVDLQNPITLVVGELITFTVPSGKIRLSITYCDSPLIKQFNLKIEDVYRLKLGAPQYTLLSCNILTSHGESYFQQDAYNDALNEFAQALNCYRTIKDQTSEGRVLFYISNVYYLQGRYEEALNSYEHVLAIRRAVGDRAGEGDVLNNIGAIYYLQGHYQDALDHFAQALVVFQEVGDRASEGSTLNNIGEVYRSQGRYQKAQAQFEQALEIRREIGDRAGEGITLNNIGEIYDNQGNYNDALIFYEDALAIAREVGNRAGEGITLNNIGGVYRKQDHYNEAMDKYNQSLAILQVTGNQIGKGTILNNIGEIYLAQEQYKDALDIFEQALAIRRKVGDRAGEGGTLNNIGSVYHAQKQYKEALGSYERSLVLLQEMNRYADEGSLFHNIGSVYYSQGRYDEALANFEQALMIRRGVGDRSGEGATLNNIAQVYSSHGEYDNALGIYEQALIILQQIGDRKGEATILDNIASIYYLQGQRSEALAQYQQALAIVQQIGDRKGEGTLLGNIAEIYYAQGRYGDMLANYEQALAIQQELGDRVGEGNSLNAISDAFYIQGQYDDALKWLMQALAIAREVGDRSGEGTTLSNIGVVYYGQERYNEALEWLEQALAIRRTMGDRIGESIILEDIGRLYQVQGDFSKALQAYLDSMAILEVIRSSAGNDQARISFINDYATLYDRVIALYYQIGDIAHAFSYSEHGRARTLLDLLATGQVQIDNNEAAALLATEQEAYTVRQSAQDVLAKARAANPPDLAWVNEAEQALKEAEAAHQKASDEIAARSDQLASLIPGRQKVLQLAEVQALLNKDTTLLSYWLLEDKALAFVITANDAKIVELPKVTAQTVLSATESLYKWTNKDNPTPKPLRELYQWLIAPLSDTLKTTYIAIIPHQQLHYVPFAALVDESHDNQYFGEQHTLSILPSASVLPFLQDNAKAAISNQSDNEVVFGDPASDQPGLPPLQYAEQEAEAVAAILNTKAITTTAATEASLHQSVQGAPVLHLAAHGEYNQGNALYSSIYLAPSQPVTSTQALTETELLPTVDTSLDGRLETHEIFGLPLKGNDLVVLSACQTNVGDLSRGDELVGLTRAFFFAGSPTVISSLWNVDDAATEMLMVSFYRHWLQEGMTKAAALQSAQAGVRADPRWVSPFYWAGFVLNGDAGQRNHLSSAGSSPR